jgi:GntR family transcriptional regulator/MocR family aminotransferase
LDQTSQPVDLLLSVSREAPRTLGAQIEDELRRAIRQGALKAGARVPSTRDLARQLGLSRSVVVDAYGQLAAEGYLVLRQGARPRVSEAAVTGDAASAEPTGPAPAPRFDFRPRAPDVSSFPRTAWLRSLREALTAITDADLGYGDPRGVEALRSALAEYLGRVRGVVADPERVIVTSGYSQGQGIVCRVLADRGARRIAFEDPSHPEQRRVATEAGLEIVPVAVDEGGVRIEELKRADVDALTRELEEEWAVVPERFAVEALVSLPSGMVMLVGQAWLAADAEVERDAEHDAHAWWPPAPEAWPDEADPVLRRMATLIA